MNNGNHSAFKYRHVFLYTCSRNLVQKEISLQGTMSYAENLKIYKFNYSLLEDKTNNSFIIIFGQHNITTHKKVCLRISIFSPMRMTLTGEYMVAAKNIYT